MDCPYDNAISKLVKVLPLLDPNQNGPNLGIYPTAVIAHGCIQHPRRCGGPVGRGGVGPAGERDGTAEGARPHPAHARPPQGEPPQPRGGLCRQGVVPRDLPAKQLTNLAVPNGLTCFIHSFIHSPPSIVRTSKRYTVRSQLAGPRLAWVARAQTGHLPFYSPNRVFFARVINLLT
eukprot:2535418-Pyramimonas_sp.AAC.1